MTKFSLAALKIIDFSFQCFIFPLVRQHSLDFIEYES